jgi:hypothetical protein
MPVANGVDVAVPVGVSWADDVAVAVGVALDAAAPVALGAIVLVG